MSDRLLKTWRWVVLEGEIGTLNLRHQNLQLCSLNFFSLKTKTAQDGARHLSIAGDGGSEPRTLTAMYKKSDYSKKLLDPRWQKKRLEVLKRDNFTCQICQSTTKTLHVHHRWYEKGCEPWDDDNDCGLVTLCADCHTEEGNKEKHLKEFSDEFKFSTTFFFTDLPDIAFAISQALPFYDRKTMIDMLCYMLWDDKTCKMVHDKWTEFQKQRELMRKQRKNG